VAVVPNIACFIVPKSGTGTASPGAAEQLSKELYDERLGY
jgi:hypothetical protein